MAVRYVLSEYVDQAMAQALYDKLEDGTFTGRIPACRGVVAFGTTLRECEDELRSTMAEYEEHLKTTIKYGQRRQEPLNPRKYRYFYPFDDLPDGSPTSLPSYSLVSTLMNRGKRSRITL